MELWHNYYKQYPLNIFIPDSVKFYTLIKGSLDLSQSNCIGSFTYHVYTSCVHISRFRFILFLFFSQQGLSDCIKMRRPCTPCECPKLLATMEGEMDGGEREREALISNTLRQLLTIKSQPRIDWPRRYCWQRGPGARVANGNVCGAINTVYSMSLF